MIEKLNPLHKPRIQHPASGYSNTLSQNVEDMHRDYVVFQKNLKNLAMLYKTRHQLMESLNENGLYTAKCYNEMLGSSPLTNAIAPRGGRHDKDRNANSTFDVRPSDRGEGTVSSVTACAVDDGESGTLSTGEGPALGICNQECDAGREPDGAKTASAISITSPGVRRSEKLGNDAVGRDPQPSTRSVASGDSVAQTEGTDSPSRGDFPDPDMEDHGKSAVSMVVSSDGMNIIVDDGDDTFVGAGDAANVSCKTAGEMETLREEDSGMVDDKDQDGRGLPSHHNESASVSGDEGTRSSYSASDDEGGKKEYLNISNDGDLVVVTSPARMKSPALMPASPCPPSLSTTGGPSYYDVYRAEYHDVTAKLEGHFQLVQYAADWLETVTTRVQSRYYEYGKHRTSLNHYAAKVDALLGEQEKLRQKDRPMKPKQVDKLERNRVKLTGARETHDDAGEALLMLMDEVVRRSWRDAFPLLRGSIVFESEFAAITHGHLTRLGESLEVLDRVGQAESIATEGRLELLRTTKIMEEIFTGVSEGLFAKTP